MLRSIGTAVMWVGRIATFVVGVVVIAALLLGPAAEALGQAGDPLRLGRNNLINELTRLTGRNNGPLLRVDNTGTGPALDLRVAGGGAPLTVNSSAAVVNLNADLLDGLDSAALVQRRTGSIGVTVDLPLIPDESCVTRNIPVTGAAVGDLPLVYPATNIGQFGPVSLLPHRVGSSGQVPVTACNASDFDVDPPSGSWRVLVVRP